MKTARAVAAILLCCVLVLLTLTGNESGGGYVISSPDEIGVNYDPYELRQFNDEWVIYETIEDVGAMAGTIAKARLTRTQEFSWATEEYVFTVLTDFIDNAEETIYVYTGKSTFFEIGGVYYLFLEGFDSYFYPKRMYSRYCDSFLVREYILDGEPVYDFRDGVKLNAGGIADLERYIWDKIVEKDAYGKNGYEYPDMTIYEAIEQADVAICVTVTEVNAENKYVSSARVDKDIALRGPAVTIADSIPVTADTSAGDKFILLYKRTATGVTWVSLEYALIPMYSGNASIVLSYFRNGDPNEK